MTIPTVRLYSKPGCHLCEHAEDLLEEITAECPLDVEIIDITTDTDLFERYRYEIPVIAVEGGGTISGRITIEDLRRALHLGLPRLPRPSAMPELPAIPRKAPPHRPE